MDKFVCVRLVQANALDLALFQFDYDITFAVFFMNGDRTIYGRYGSRSERKGATKDISIESFRQALAAHWICTSIIRRTRQRPPAKRRPPQSSKRSMSSERRP